MTALCGGGTSGPKSGVAETIIFGAGELATLLEQSGNPWLVFAAPLLGVISYDAINLCQTDPPTIPTFTKAEANAVLGLTLGADFTSGIAKFRDLVYVLIWNQLCQCTSAPQPTPPPPVQPPSGFAVQTTKNYCAEDTSHESGQQFSASGQGNVTIGTVGAGATSVEWFGTVTPQSGINFNPNFTLSFRNGLSGGAGIHPIGTVSLPQSGAFSYVFAVPQGFGTTSISSVYNPVSSSSGVVLISWDVGSNCGSASNQCCPPDPQIANLVNQINDLANQILTAVTLVQRQAVPFAYVPGTAHNGLSGHGELSVSGLLGAKITPSAIPSWAGVVSGDPDALWLDSWINWGNADGWTSREFLRASPYVSLPQLAGQFTKIGYSLAPGLTVDLVELLREP